MSDTYEDSTTGYIEYTEPEKEIEPELEEEDKLKVDQDYELPTIGFNGLKHSDSEVPRSKVSMEKNVIYKFVSKLKSTFNYWMSAEHGESYFGQTMDVVEGEKPKKRIRQQIDRFCQDTVPKIVTFIILLTIGYYVYNSYKPKRLVSIDNHIINNRGVEVLNPMFFSIDHYRELSQRYSVPEEFRLSYNSSDMMHFFINNFKHITEEDIEDGYFTVKLNDYELGNIENYDDEKGINVTFDDIIRIGSDLSIDENRIVSVLEFGIPANMMILSEEKRNRMGTRIKTISKLMIDPIVYDEDPHKVKWKVSQSTSDPDAKRPTFDSFNAPKSIALQYTSIDGGLNIYEIQDATKVVYPYFVLNIFLKKVSYGDSVF